MLVRLGITPNELTFGSLGLTIAAGVLFAFDQWLAGALVLIVGGFLDGIDGEYARYRGLSTQLGAFLDSICDHIGDLAIFLGLLWHFMGVNNHTAILLILVALFGSLFGSHVRSRAGMVGIETKEVGLFTRLERTLVLIVGILVNQLVPALWVVAVFNNLSALQRIFFILRASRQGAGAPQ